MDSKSIRVKVGLKTRVAHAADIPTSDKERKQKEDKRDARKISKALKKWRVSMEYMYQHDQALNRPQKLSTRTL